MHRSILSRGRIVSWARRGAWTAAIVLALSSAPQPASAVTINWTGVVSGQGMRIDKYEVTNSQYVELLNAKDPTGANTLGLYNDDMSNALGGINYNAGNANGSKYSVISGDGYHPVNAVTWYDAIRFTNWLNNGQGSGSTETGAYTLLGGTPTPSNGNSITRNAGATVFMPNENEWYAAAYFSPPSTYYDYPTTSYSVPNATGPTGVPNSANYDGAVGSLTDVGAYTGTKSPSGAFDMGGNVYEWNETLYGGNSRQVRGGAFDTDSTTLANNNPINFFRPFYVIDDVGFRVATTVPEPSTGVLAVLACGMMWWCRKKWFK